MSSHTKAEINSCINSNWSSCIRSIILEGGDTNGLMSSCCLQGHYQHFISSECHSLLSFKGAAIDSGERAAKRTSRPSGALSEAPPPTFMMRIAMATTRTTGATLFIANSKRKMKKITRQGYFMRVFRFFSYYRVYFRFITNMVKLRSSWKRKRKRKRSVDHQPVADWLEKCREARRVLSVLSVSHDVRTYTDGNVILLF